MQDSSADWWQTLRIHTVPGAIHRFQHSATLADGEWETIATTYGNDFDWLCPILPGTAPAEAPPSGSPTLPAAPPTSVRIVFLDLEKTSNNESLISWTSLDDQSPKRMILSGVTLDPIWGIFDSSYLSAQGTSIFGINPRLHDPVTFSNPPPVLGPLDSGMVAEFTSSLPSITQDISDSVASAALSTPHPENPSAKGFYRFAADWGVDSDQVGRMDWEELLIDGNNPFAANSNGDGQPDSAADNSSASATELPTLTDPQPPTPSAHIQSRSFVVSTTTNDFMDDGGVARHTQIARGPNWIDESELDGMAGSSSAAALGGSVNALEMPDDWSDNLFPFYSEFARYIEPGTDRKEIRYERVRFRLKLDAPAPYGGYHIPLRIATMRETFSQYDNTGILPPANQISTAFQEIMLECEEGETEGIPVEMPDPGTVSENESIVCIPAHIELREPDLKDLNGDTIFHSGEMPADGLCIEELQDFVASLNTSVDLTGQLPTGFVKPLIRWEQRNLKGDGLSVKWEGMTTGTPAFPGADDSYVTIRLSWAGIHQVDAVLSYHNGVEVRIPHVGMQDARSIRNSEHDDNTRLFAGQRDYFGVTKGFKSLELRNAAITWLGSKKYAKAAPMISKIGPLYWNPNLAGRPKCNLFVTHLANNIGVTTPY